MRLVERMARSHATLVGSIGGPADARQALISYEIGFREAVALAKRLAMEGAGSDYQFVVLANRIASLPDQDDEGAKV
jgi:hypothetical protein